MLKTVVVVDDESITRMDMSDMLREVGFSVIGEAADGFDAIELCRVTRPDVVLMDVKMPIFDGLAALETILNEELAGCVVLLTAFCDREIIDRASAAGAAGYLIKPIKQQVLFPTIEVAYAQSQRLRERKAQAEEAIRRIQEDRQIHKAQQYLAQSQGCTETEAYRKMRKVSMDKRISVAALAEHILLQAAKSTAVEETKQLLISRNKLTDERAYQYIVNYGKSLGCGVEAAAQQLKTILTRGE